MSPCIEGAREDDSMKKHSFVPILIGIAVVVAMALMIAVIEMKLR
jgi:hypothetical protein